METVRLCIVAKKYNSMFASIWPEKYISGKGIEKYISGLGIEKAATVNTTTVTTYFMPKRVQMFLLTNLLIVSLLFNKEYDGDPITTKFEQIIVKLI